VKCGEYISNHGVNARREDHPKEKKTLQPSQCGGANWLSASCRDLKGTGGRNMLCVHRSERPLSQAEGPVVDC